MGYQTKKAKVPVPPSEIKIYEKVVVLHKDHRMNNYQMTARVEKPTKRGCIISITDFSGERPEGIDVGTVLEITDDTREFELFKF